MFNCKGITHPTIKVQYVGNYMSKTCKLKPKANPSAKTKP